MFFLHQRWPRAIALKPPPSGSEQMQVFLFNLPCSTDNFFSGIYWYRRRIQGAHRMAALGRKALPWSWCCG